MVEFQKIRRRRIWVIVGLMVLVEILWSLWGTGRMDARDRVQGWMFLLYQFPLLNAIIMPTIAAVVASRLSDMEHKGQTLKMLNTVMPAGRLFAAKFLCGAMYMLAAVFLQLIVMVAFGLSSGFSGPPPVDKLLNYLLFTTSVNLTLLLLQQVLSLLVKNQIVALAVGLVGSFAGLFIMFFPQNFTRLVLWGYYGVLMQVGMNWDRATRITDFYYTPVDWAGFLTLALAFVAIYVVGRALFLKKEV
jgi:ABC-type transport system involved in multi-copper enzyme maturation permease subunit